MCLKLLTNLKLSEIFLNVKYYARCDGFEILVFCRFEVLLKYN
jgi:hypothetical protein